MSTLVALIINAMLRAIRTELPSLATKRGVYQLEAAMTALQSTI
jgi:hypothetical protein